MAPLVFLVLATFGPYTPVAGVRCEQVAAFSLCLIGLCRLRWLCSTPDPFGLATVALLATIAVIAAVGLLLPPVNVSGLVSGSALGGLDNMLLPIAVIIATWTLGTPAALKGVCVAIVCAATVNALVAAVSISQDLTPYLKPFWDNQDVQTVAERAGGLGRYTGIMNQPAEAGELYSIALLAAVHLWHDRAARLVTVCTVLTVGGILTVSKIFLLIGLPIATWQILVPQRVCSAAVDRAHGAVRHHPARGQHRGAARRVVALCLVGVAAWGVIQSGLLPRWSGTDFLGRLFDPAAGGHSALDLYTAGRFGERSTLSTAVDAVLSTSPWFGFGATGLAIPYDNGWVEAFVFTGAAGAVLYTAVLAVLVLAWLRHRSRFTGGLVLVLIGASVGLPALTANRVATCAWILVTLLLFCGDPTVPPHLGASSPGSGEASPVRPNLGPLDSHADPRDQQSPDAPPSALGEAMSPRSGEHLRRSRR